MCVAFAGLLVLLLLLLLVILAEVVLHALGEQRGRWARALLQRAGRAYEVRSELEVVDVLNGRLVVVVGRRVVQLRAAEQATARLGRAVAALVLVLLQQLFVLFVFALAGERGRHCLFEKQLLTLRVVGEVFLELFFVCVC